MATFEELLQTNGDNRELTRSASQDIHSDEIQDSDQDIEIQSEINENVFTTLDGVYEVLKDPQLILFAACFAGLFILSRELTDAGYMNEYASLGSAALLGIAYLNSAIGILRAGAFTYQHMTEDSNEDLGELSEEQIMKKAISAFMEAHDTVKYDEAVGILYPEKLNITELELLIEEQQINQQEA